MPQYYGAGAGQSGSFQGLGGAIAGAIDDDNKDKIVPRYYSDVINARANAYAKLFKPKDVTAAYNAFNAAYGANSGLAQQNAGYYSDLAKGIFSDTKTPEDVYGNLRSGNLASLKDVYQNVLDYGLGAEKAKLAAGGYGNTGPSSYDRILSSTLTSSNMAPVLNTIYSGLGPAASSLYSLGKGWDQYRLNQFSQDPLTAYYDRVAGRTLVPLGAYRSLINNDVGGMSNLLKGVIVPNVAGWDLKPGLASDLNNVAAGTSNLLNTVMSTYGGMGGMGGGTGVPQAQNNQMLNEYMRGVPTMGSTSGVPYAEIPYQSPYYGVDTPYNPNAVNSPALYNAYA